MNKFLKENGILLLILLTGAVMRFAGFADFSLTNDELSALLRSYHPTFSEMIEKGVISTDPHPAGLQIFIYYWIKVFGDGAFMLRLPFVLLSILTIWMVYKVTELWFGKPAALPVAAAMAALEFPIMYGQIARPYSVGLFFGMALVYCWTRLLFHENKRVLYGIGYAVFAALCCYTHYFCGLFAMVVGLTGLLFLKRSTWKIYFLANLAVIVLFIPHLGITLHQLEVGGLSGWLPKPRPDFFMTHLLFIFNNSLFLFSLCIAAAITLIVKYRKLIRFSSLQLVAITWFLLPPVVGYFYSMNHQTVLMDRVLLFTFPYLLIFMFSFVRNMNLNIQITAMLILAGGVYSTVVEKDFYSRQRFEDFRLLAEKSIEWDEKYGRDSITHTINLNSPLYVNYYLERMGHFVRYEQYQTIEGKQIHEFMKLIERSDKPYFMEGWACIYNPYEIPELIKRKYPVEQQRVKAFNTGITLYRKDPAAQRDTVIDMIFDFEKQGPLISGWDTTFLDTSESYSGTHSYHYRSGNEYGPTLRVDLSKVVEDSIEVISLSVFCKTNDTLNAMLVMSFDRNGETLSWHAANASDFISPDGEWHEIFMSCKVPDHLNPGDQVVFYLWNPGHNDFHADRLRLSAFKDSRYGYYE